jgi:hypothetical protein
MSSINGINLRNDITDFRRIRDSVLPHYYNTKGAANTLSPSVRGIMMKVIKLNLDKNCENRRYVQVDDGEVRCFHG